ncbi:HEAT repeat domain-containing protein [Mesorhizobium sp. M0040]|uniref:HEAT repeat domain-containing protein n=1 Tax=Mesorhizobium sp. M0040 TaxID=2956855 RepID=UPI00333BBD9F
MNYHFTDAATLSGGSLTEIPATVFNRDPSDSIEFSKIPIDNVNRFDIRGNDVLADAVVNNSNCVERERALWELGDRRFDGIEAIIKGVMGGENNADVRRSALWLAQKYPSSSTREILLRGLSDGNPDVEDWARLLLNESEGRLDVDENERRAIAFDPNNLFDQTLPLTIAGHALVRTPLGYSRITLSPLWFEEIMGRVMACTREASFRSQLVIEKKIKSYHPDGSDHFEIFNFSGMSVDISERMHHHLYQARSAHSFYLSGKVEDTSAPVIPDVASVLERVAITLTASVGEKLERLSPGRPGPSNYVKSVRGRYMGFAYVNLARVIQNGMSIGPGEVQLVDPHHPIAGPLANVLLFGSFKGLIARSPGLPDILNLNTEPAHATEQGLLDFGLVGEPNPDPYDPYSLT